jgi:hypothetical protein
MESSQKVYNLIILDVSGSRDDLKTGQNPYKDTSGRGQMLHYTSTY